MISARLFDHTVTIWRSYEVRGGALREVERKWTECETDVRMAIQPRRERREDGGPGQFTGGKYNGFGANERDVKEGDVIQVTSGPEAPATLEVDAVSRPRGNHTEVVLVSWQGDLP